MTYPFLQWIGGTDQMPVSRYDLLWPWVTIALSVLVAIGYCVIAIDWYFQSKLSRTTESKAALGRLRGICLCCAICGYAFFAIDIPWVVWRLYDLVLFVLVFHTWSFVFSTRGLSLVDERLAQVDELERSATRYRQIAELLPHMVWTANSEGRVDFSNERWHQYAGDERTWVDAVHPDDRAEVTTRWSQSLAARQPFHLEARLADQTHGYRTFLVNATPIVQGNAVKWLGACADVEDQKLLAAEKERQAKQRAFFFNALSHDLRAPLHNVLLNAELLKESVQDQKDIQSVNSIAENAVAAGELVSKLLDFARIGALEHNSITSVSLSASLDQVVSRFKPLAEKKGIDLRVACGFQSPVRTDRQKLERIISNLVDNAIKHTTSGGVSIVVEPVAGNLFVRVTDTGSGVPQESIPHLFQEFYQTGGLQRERGFGMGLAICKVLAGHIGGDVRLAKTGPDGSCFELILAGACAPSVKVTVQGIGENSDAVTRTSAPNEPCAAPPWSAPPAPAVQ